MGENRVGIFQAAEERLNAVILSEAKNLGSCSLEEPQRSFVACGSSG
jgi:hypothetical protein